MQKLEDELGVTLFKRTPNHISLTETGQLATKEAEKLLEAKQAFIDHIQDFEKHSGKIRLGSVAPGPLYIAEDVASEHISIDNNLLSEGDLLLNCFLKIINSFLHTKKFKQITSNHFMSARKVYMLTVMP